jgi:hypothetical protein
MTITGAQTLDRLSGLTRKSEPSLLQLAGHAQNDPCTGDATVKNGPRAEFRCLRIQWLNRFCLRFRGRYVAVHGISGTGARPHVHIDDMHRVGLS